ncbi:amino acid ABC transporter permease [Acidovorax sp.]|uniref:amino acid ABC transporter permease n=1 Tax=Acidovorax sp. TaxID=1872122 RepID=UPI003BB025ED
MNNFGLPETLLLAKGLQWTVLLTLTGFVGGVLGGLVVALCRVSPLVPLRLATVAFIEVFRGTPLLLQLFVVFYGLSVLGFSLSAWTSVAICLTLNASAFLGEIWRGSIQALPGGQSEAASALGLHYLPRMRHVVMPQALKISLPATVGFLVQLLKGTSLASIVGFAELMRSGAIVSNATFNPLFVYSVVAALYFALCWPLSLYGRHMEKRLAGAQRTG